ncbi:hypothetical protein ES705_40077 [subsurface metagenome]
MKINKNLVSSLHRLVKKGNDRKERKAEYDNQLNRKKQKKQFKVR